MAPTINPPLAGFTPAPAGLQPGNSHYRLCRLISFKKFLMKFSISGQPQQPYAPGATAPIITAPGAAPPVTYTVPTGG